jgi:hypothetical protein
MRDFTPLDVILHALADLDAEEKRLEEKREILQQEIIDTLAPILSEAYTTWSPKPGEEAIVLLLNRFPPGAYIVRFLRERGNDWVFEEAPDGARISTRRVLPAKGLEIPTFIVPEFIWKDLQDVVKVDEVRNNFEDLGRRGLRKA